MNDLTSDEIDHLYWFLRAAMPHCGCGDPEASEKLILDLLDLIAASRGRDAIDQLGGEAIAQIVLGAMEAAGLLEHGTSYATSWVTERGEWVRVAGRKLDVDELDHAAFPHGGGSCPPSCKLGNLHYSQAASQP